MQALKILQKKNFYEGVFLFNLQMGFYMLSVRTLNTTMHTQFHIIETSTVELKFRLGKTAYGT